MTSHLDPDRVPGAPPGYRPVTGVLGSCDRCGVAVDVENPTAKRDHERFHQGLRAMWATAHSTSPPTPEQEEAPAPARSRVGGANHHSNRPAASEPAGSRDATTPPGPSPPGPGGTTRRSRPGGRQPPSGRAGDTPGRAGDPDAAEQAEYERRVMRS